MPRKIKEVRENIKRQRDLEHSYHDALCLEAGYRTAPPCCKTLHVSLFFDGTGNNFYNDAFMSHPPHPTNIARLFRATIGDGHVGGMGHTGIRAQELIDGAVRHGEYFKYYMPGVGTPFPEIGDLDYTTRGLASAYFGEERINWGLMMIIDALRRTLGGEGLTTDDLKAAIRAMGTWMGAESWTGSKNRKTQFNKQLQSLKPLLEIAFGPPIGGQSKLLAVKLYVYGFSRGAAAARAFVSWLNELLGVNASLEIDSVSIPLSVAYLGVLDTVASVGIADVLPGARGHMSWADGNQELPNSGLVKRCLHLVSSHEQRLCFPLDSIRRQTGEYPVNCAEVIYAGVHSDLGGGYPPGDQGKANGRGDGDLLSQIALHDLYADAFVHGAPLKIQREKMPADVELEPWRIMDPVSSVEFEVSPEVVKRFNAWRQVTLSLRTGTEMHTLEHSTNYQPLLGSTTLEQAIRSQLAWITAWRIDRYGFASLKQTPFYQQASNTHSDPVVQGFAKEELAKQQALIKKKREAQLAAERTGRVPKRPLPPGLPQFDADIAQTQLLEAAEEFAAAYRNPHGRASALTRLVPAKSPPAFVLRIITADARHEGEHLKDVGQQRVRILFPPKEKYRSHLDENYRGEVDENRNATQPEGLLRALFDDQVHDSRAWFLYSMGREPLGSYFRERMVFFGEASRREVAMHGEARDTRVVEAVGDAEHMAQARQSINTRWETYYAKHQEVTDDLA
ncbi:T6SS phospholipase effector Tle1-like catalytic domain-containing protein [Pseudomonas sp. TE3610]